jgi:hypothetical protein
VGKSEMQPVMHIVRHEDCKITSCVADPQTFEGRRPLLSSQFILGFPLDLTEQPSIVKQGLISQCK